MGRRWGAEKGREKRKKIENVKVYVEANNDVTG